jgi:DNA polymerase I-like protein with 3'-5' exonuclease and polymerase domains
MLDGWLFDQEAASFLINVLEKRIRELDEEITTVLPWRVIKGNPVNNPFKRNGELTKIAEAYGNVVGPFTRVSFELPNIQSRQQLAEALIKTGWVPTEFTEKGAPRLSEEQLEQLSGELGGKIAERFTCVKRRATIHGWLQESLVRGDHRITCGAFSCGADSRRMTHKNVTSVPKAEAGIFLGSEMRDLFIAPEGYTIVGADAAGIQLRNLAHYMNDDAFTNAIVNGRKEDETDVHSITCKRAGFTPSKLYNIDGRQGTGRDVGKTINYSLIFRAGNEKMGKVIGGSERDGAKLKKTLLKNMPRYQDLVDRSERVFNERGYVIALDGGKIFPPSAFAALNYLIQGAEAVCMKVAIAKMMQLWYNKQLDATLLGVWHDETQSQVLIGQEQLAGEAFNQGLQFACRYLSHRCPLVGEWKHGPSWKHTHRS